MAILVCKLKLGLRIELRCWWLECVEKWIYVSRASRCVSAGTCVCRSVPQECSTVYWDWGYKLGWACMQEESHDWRNWNVTTGVMGVIVSCHGNGSRECNGCYMHPVHWGSGCNPSMNLHPGLGVLATPHWNLNLRFGPGANPVWEFCKPVHRQSIRPRTFNLCGCCICMGQMFLSVLGSFWWWHPIFFLWLSSLVYWVPFSCWDQVSTRCLSLLLSETLISVTKGAQCATWNRRIQSHYY